MTAHLRPELPRPIPDRILRLPVDGRGYPVPWFVQWIDGAPEFRAMDLSKWVNAVKSRLCWVCGDQLGRYLSFVLGPMCGVNRTSSEPPCHLDCADWSARACPFLSRPHMVRREDDRINHQTLTEHAPGFAIPRNPGVALVWTTLSYRIYRADAGGAGYLIEIGEPVHVRWYAEGRKATRAEVEASVLGGLPKLDAMCDRDRDPAEARRVLRQYHARLEALYPSDGVRV